MPLFDDLTLAERAALKDLYAFAQLWGKAIWKMDLEGQLDRPAYDSLVERGLATTNHLSKATIQAEAGLQGGLLLPAALDMMLSFFEGDTIYQYQITAAGRLAWELGGQLTWVDQAFGDASEESDA